MLSCFWLIWILPSGPFSSSLSSLMADKLIRAAFSKTADTFIPSFALVSNMLFSSISWFLANCLTSSKKTSLLLPELASLIKSTKKSFYIHFYTQNFNWLLRLVPHKIILQSGSFSRISRSQNSTFLKDSPTVISLG